MDEQHLMADRLKLVVVAQRIAAWELHEYTMEVLVGSHKLVGA